MQTIHILGSGVYSLIEFLKENKNATAFILFKKFMMPIEFSSFREIFYDHGIKLRLE